jgi:hypothetical protein
MRDPWEVLGVARGASSATIKAAFREKVPLRPLSCSVDAVAPLWATRAVSSAGVCCCVQARMLHPDVQPTKAEAEHSERRCALHQVAAPLVWRRGAAADGGGMGDTAFRR